MNANNVYDYLIPVGEAGDKIFTNGQQDKIVTKEDERKAEEMIKQIALQKQLDLERGNTKHIMEMINQDSPEAAIYRAMLLGEQEKLQKLNNNALKKKDEGNKPGIVKRVAGFVGKTALNTAKYMGMTALQYLAMKALFNAGNIKRQGLGKTWKQWMVEAGVARTPDLAEKFGDSVAGLGDDIVKRSVPISSMTPEQQKTAIAYADKVAKKSVDTSKAHFDLMGVFKDADGNYFNDLPKDASPEDFTKEYGYFLNTGEKGDALIPVNKSDFGTNAFNSIFKVGNVDALITPEDKNWFTANPHVRSLDNQVWRIGKITGYNTKHRLNSKYALPYNVGDKGSEIKDAAKTDYTSRIMNDKKKYTNTTIADVVKHTHHYGIFKDPHFKVNTKTVMKMLDMMEKNPNDPLLSDNLFNQMDVNYQEGILPSDMENFFGRALELKHKYTKPGEKDILNRKMQQLINYYTDRDTVLFDEHAPYFSKEGRISGNPLRIEQGTINSWLAGILGASAVGALSYLKWAKGYRFPTKKFTKQKQRRSRKLRKH